MLYLEQMQTLVNEQTTTSFLTGEELPTGDKYLWLISYGVIKTYTYNEEGTSVTLGFWGEGDVVGTALSSLNPYFLKCLSNVKAIAIPDVKKESLAKQLLYHGQQTQQLTYIVRNNRIASRLWLLLKWLGSKFGRVIQEGKLIDFNLTHQELAETIGTTRITVTKLLNQFEQEDLILRPKSKCIILKE